MLPRTLGAVAALSLALVSVPLFAQAPIADRGQQIEALITAGNLEAAVEACRTWVKEDAQATRPHLVLAGVYTRLKLYDRAAEELETVIDLNPASATGHVRLGDLLRRQGKLEAAKTEYLAALAISPKGPEAFVGLAHVALDGQKPEEAAAAVDTALGMAPDNAAVLALAGELANRSGNFAEAATRFKQALDKDPKCADALYGMALLIQGQGQAEEEEAQKYWDRFLEAEVDTERAWAVKYGLVVIAVKEVRSMPSIDQRPVFSPDGTMLAFSGIAKPENLRTWEVYVVPADGSQPPKPATTGGGAQYANWMPDGKHLLFDFFYEPTGTRTRSFITSAAGDETPKCLSPEAAICRNAAPLPGTDRIVCCDAFRFYTIKPDGSDRQPSGLRLPPSGEANHVAVAPDGKSVAYMYTKWDEKREGGPAHHIVVARLDGSLPPRRISADYVGARLGYSGPAWAPDCRRLAYTTDEDHPSASWDILVQVLDDPHPPLKLLHGSRPSWSPDGTKLVFDTWTARDRGALFIAQLGGKRLPPVKP